MDETQNQKPELQKDEIKNRSFFYYFFKRTFDIISSFIVLLILSPFLLIVLIIQLFATKGHPFFLDKRIGKKGKEILVYKFRSMYYDAETNIEKYLSKEQIETWARERKLDNDPRITPFGRFIRKTSIDELPQLFNIFIGSMSVVGPRPMSRKEVFGHFSEEERNLLFSARPGLTGYWQVCGRSDTSFDSGRRQSMEMEYFRKRSLWFDLKIIFKTIPAVLSQKGAK